MAVIIPTVEAVNSGMLVVRWAALANGDTGTPFEAPNFADKSVQIQGTFGAGGTILFEGTNDSSNYVTLTDPNATALSFTAAGIKQVLENPRLVRPRVSAGDGTTALNVTAVFRTNTR